MLFRETAEGMHVVEHTADRGLRFELCDDLTEVGDEISRYASSCLRRYPYLVDGLVAERSTIGCESKYCINTQLGWLLAVFVIDAVETMVLRFTIPERRHM